MGAHTLTAWGVHPSSATWQVRDNDAAWTLAYDLIQILVCAEATLVHGAARSPFVLDVCDTVTLELVSHGR